MRYRRQLSHPSHRDFLLDAVQALELLRLYFFTLRPGLGGVNQSACDCEQAVIPVADTKPPSEYQAKHRTPDMRSPRATLPLR